MKHFLYGLFRFSLLLAVIAGCGWATLYFSGCFDAPPMVAYIQAEGAGYALPDSVRASLEQEGFGFQLYTQAEDPAAKGAELLQAGVCTLILDLDESLRAPAALLKTAEEHHATLLFVGQHPGRQALAYEKSWYLYSDPAHAGELLGKQAALLFREGIAADRNEDHLLQYVWAGVLGNGQAHALRTYALIECEHYGVYTALGAELEASASELAAMAVNEWAVLDAPPELVLTSDPEALKAALEAAGQLGWLAPEQPDLPFLTCANSKEQAQELLEQGAARAVAYYDLEQVTRYLAQFALNAVQSRYVADGMGLYPDGNCFVVPYQLLS